MTLAFLQTVYYTFLTSHREDDLNNLPVLSFSNSNQYILIKALSILQVTSLRYSAFCYFILSFGSFPADGTNPSCLKSPHFIKSWRTNETFI